MATKLQVLGDKGEELVRAKVDCPKCKKARKSLRILPRNFRCADLICDFCGYLAQVKTTTVDDPTKLPKSILGAAWEPQRERMEAGIYFPLFIVATTGKSKSLPHIYYLPADFQTEAMFIPRTPLSSTAKRAGWQGYMIDLTKAVADPVRLI
jgi:type II restriction enzyme